MMAIRMAAKHTFHAMWLKRIIVLLIIATFTCCQYCPLFEPMLSGKVSRMSSFVVSPSTVSAAVLRGAQVTHATWDPGIAWLTNPGECSQRYHEWEGRL